MCILIVLKTCFIYRQIPGLIPVSRCDTIDTKDLVLCVVEFTSERDPIAKNSWKKNTSILEKNWQGIWIQSWTKDFRKKSASANFNWQIHITKIWRTLFSWSANSCRWISNHQMYITKRQAILFPVLLDSRQVRTQSIELMKNNLKIETTKWAVNLNAVLSL